MPTFEAARLLHADWEYLQTLHRRDLDAIIGYLSGLKGHEGKG